MSKTSEQSIKEKALLQKKVQLINLAAPKLINIEESFKTLIGPEVANEQILTEFAKQYFQLIETDAINRFPENKIGLRAVMGNTTQENLQIEKLNRLRPVTAIKQILEKGSDINGLITRITKPNGTRGGESNTGMSDYYLKTMIKETLNAKTDKVIPLVLIYDLDRVQERTEYEVEFPDEETMKDSLLAIYFVDYSSLVAAFN